MLNKILVFGGIALSAILIIENMVMTTPAFVFVSSSQSYVLSVVSILIGIGIGYGLRGFATNNESDSNEFDF